MKFNFVYEFKCNEIEIRMMVDYAIGVIALAMGFFFDPIAKKFAITHQQGFGAGQIWWCAFWGLYLVWTINQFGKWREK